MAVGFPRPIQLRRLLRDLSNMGLAAIDLLGTELGEKSYQDTNLLNDGGSRAALIEGAVQARDTRLPVLRVFPDVRSWLLQRPWEDVLPQIGAILVAADNIPKGPQMGPLLIAADNMSPLLIAADNVRPQEAFANLEAKGRTVVLAVGSERGWSDRERDLLETAGFLRLSMGKRALRTETACVAAAALILEKTGALK
jgi:16S rRNA U1498 N3-methylase RsmE